MSDLENRPPVSDEGAAASAPSPAPADGRPSDVDGLASAEGAEADRDSFSVVGIGASAGGLRAFQEFFSALPAQPGMAFVLVQHLSPDHESALAELIQRRTQMEVTQVADHPTVEPNRVYVIPPGKHLEIEDGHLQLVELHREQGRPAAVDHFFRTLAEDMGERAVCVVLSGTGSDGSLGLKAIKERTGLTMAQTPGDAEYAGMPRSAIATDLVDVQGTAAELARKLVDIRNAAGRIELATSDREPIPEDDHQALEAIFAHLRQRTAHDFAQYKRATILRRLARRLQVTGHESLSAYAAFLRATPEEVHALLRDFLISVTQFFRDPEAFAQLEQKVIPKLFQGKGRHDQVRVWVAGCATGEEAYSIAMLLCEHRSRLEEAPDVQVFATDIDEDALVRAREGQYLKVAAADVPPSLLRRYFEVEGGGVRVKSELRQMVLFAHHNLISDPPFSRLDLVTCRNVLIYLNREIQTRVFATFHYALNPGGTLFLGSAEGPDALSKGFRAEDKKHRVYRRKDTSNVPRLPSFTVGDGRRGTPPARARAADPPHEGLVERYADWTLERYAPPRLLVDEHYDVTHVFGDAGQYLHDREGPVTQNVVDKVLRTFRIDLRAALFKAFSKGEATDTRFQRVEIRGQERVVRLHVGLVGGRAAEDGLAEVVFIQLDPASVDALGATVGERDGGDDDPTVAKMEEELRRLRARLQATQEESETSNEELKASNEELQSINEELQSTTEELETSKEELQSTNEELTTVNQELKSNLEELLRANSDLQNLIASTDIGTVFLDRSLRIKRFTPRAAELFNVIPSDVGRPFAHVTHHLVQEDFGDDARRVLDTLAVEEREVESDDGRWYVVRILPYRTVDDRVEGVVVTFVDVTELKSARDEASRRAGQQAAVAALGRAALGGSSFDVLSRSAAEALVEHLGADRAGVLEYRSETDDLLLCAGEGWPDEAVGALVVPLEGRDDLLASDEVTVIEDHADDPRFEGARISEAYGARSGISMRVQGAEGEAWGVVGAHSTTPRRFTAYDVEFVEAVANVLSDARRREADAQTIHEQLAEIEAVYGTAPVGLAYMDSELRYRRINERLAEINGLPVQEHIGKRGKDLFPMLADTVEPLLQQVLHTGEAVEDIEFKGATLRDPDDLRDWLCSYVPEVGDEGEVLGVSVVVRDITQRKRAEARLTETLSRLELAMDTPGLAAYDVDLVGQTTTYDARAQALLGEREVLPFDQAVGRAHEEDADALRASIDAACDPASDDPTFRSVHRHIRPDGAELWIAARGRALFEGEGDERRAVRLIGVALDVTDIRMTQQRLRRQLAEVESYFDAVPVGISVLDREKRYIRVNRQLAHVNGMEPDEMVGVAASTLFPEHATVLDPYIDRVLSNGIPILNLDARLPRPADGEPRDWLISVYPLRDGDAVTGVSVVIQDVTVIRKAQSALERQAAELEERVVERTGQVRQLAAELTHAEQAERQRIAQILHDDLQQLLYALQVKMQLLLRLPGDDAVAASRRELVAETEALIDRAVQTSRSLTADLSPPLLQDEGFERALAWAAHRMQEAYGLEVSVEGATNVELQPDLRILLFRIVRELLFNTVKHAGVGQARIEIEQDDHELRITVSDEGEGFDPASLDDGAAGVGLFSARERLRLIGGSMTVESAPDEGTRVRIVSPMNL